MKDIFTVEEINLLCIFDTSNRTGLIFEVSNAIGAFTTGDPQSDAEIREIAERALAKLGDMSDAEFAALELRPEYGGDDDYEQED